MVPPPFIQFTLSHDLQASKGVLQGRANFCSQQDVNCFIALNSFHICLVGTVIEKRVFSSQNLKYQGTLYAQGRVLLKRKLYYSILYFNIYVFTNIYR